MTTELSSPEVGNTHIEFICMTMGEPRSNTQVYFDPDDYPNDTLKSFKEFAKVFELRYNAQYPDLPKMSLDAAINRWEIVNITADNATPTPTADQYDEICEKWRSKDQVAKVLGMFSSHKLYEDWCIAEPGVDERKKAEWKDFVEKMSTYYRPTENITLKHYQFRGLNQLSDESFARYCNRVEAEARHCSFKCDSPTCTAEHTAIRDQIIIGSSNNDIREEALKKAWNLKLLRFEGTKMESAAIGGVQITGDISTAINKLGKYSYTNIKKNNTTEYGKNNSLTCFNCGNKVTGSIFKHKEKCPANNQCRKCAKYGHFESMCRSSKDLKQFNTENKGESEQNEAINTITLFNIKMMMSKRKTRLGIRDSKKDFKVQVVINNHLDRVVADTGVCVSVCGTLQAKRWGMLGRLSPSTVEI